VTPKLTKTVSLPEQKLLGFFDDGTIKVCDELTLGDAIWRNGRDLSEITAAAPQTDYRGPWLSEWVQGTEAIKAVPLPDMTMLVVFRNGAIKLWSAKGLLSCTTADGSAYDPYQRLKDEEFFRSFTLDRDQIIWGHYGEGPDDVEFGETFECIYVAAPTVINGDPDRFTVAEMIRPLPLHRIHLNDTLKDVLYRAGVRTVGELLDMERPPKVKGVGKKTWQKIMEIRGEILNSLP